MELAYFFKLLKKNWIFITLICVVAAVATFVLLTVKKKEYYSRGQISAGITENNQVAFDKSELSWNDINNKFTNFLEFLNSKEVFTMLSYRMMIHEIESKGSFKAKEYKELTQKYSPENLQIAKTLLKKKHDNQELLDLTNKDDHAIHEMMKMMYYDPKILAKTLTISRITGSDYFKVEVKTANPVLSSSLVNWYCEEAIRANNATETKKAEKSVAFFKELRDKKKEDFERKLDSLGRVKTGSQVVNFTSQSEAHIEKISTLEKAKSDEEQKITGLKRAISSIDAQLSQAEQKSHAAHTTNNNIVNLKSKIEHLNNRYINSGFKDKAAADSLTHLRHQLEKNLNQLTQNLQSGTNSTYKDLLAKKIDYEIELSMAEASLNSLESNIYASKSSLSQFAGNEAALTPLEMSVSVAKDEYMRVVDRYNEARNEALKNGAVVRQIEMAQPADEPEASKRVVFSAVAAAASFALSVSVIFLIAYFDNTIRNPENFGRNTGLPLLGFVYNLAEKTSNLENIFFDNTAEASQDHVKFKEQLRNMRYEVEKSEAKVLLFTSTDREEGKSFVIISLAYSLILNYKKVLLIDTNFKHNTLSNLYHGKDEFEDYFYQPERKLLNQANHAYSIESSQKPESAAEDIIQSTNIDGLDIISCKGNNLSPSEIFHGKKFEELLDRLRVRYDYIFMEGPSLNLYSDTKELSVYSDKVIGVFAADKSVKQIDNVSIKYLKSIGDKYLGSILNKVDSDDLLI